MFQVGDAAGVHAGVVFHLASENGVFVPSFEQHSPVLIERGFQAFGESGNFGDAAFVCPLQAFDGRTCDVHRVLECFEFRGVEILRLVLCDVDQGSEEHLLMLEFTVQLASVGFQLIAANELVRQLCTQCQLPFHFGDHHDRPPVAGLFGA